MSRITDANIGSNVYQYWQRVMLYGPLNNANATPAQWYQMLHSYYLNNGVYDAIQQAMYSNAIWTPAMKGLRNPAHRAVEFYVAKLWPGTLPEALPIKTANEKIIPAIWQVWAWSNWSQKKQLAARWVGEYGDWFVKVATNGGENPDRVYFQNIRPEYVIDFEEDERGFITYIRVEIPKTGMINGKETSYTHVEIWDKEKGTYQRYVLTVGQTTSTTTPAETVEISAYGIDFVPFVHAKFQDIGEKRGVGCFVHALDKIDEANRMATRLHQILFRYNKPTMALSANGQDAQGRPLPPPTIAGAASTGEISIADTDIWPLPGNASLESIVPSIDYQSYIAEIAAQMDEIKQDLPEVKYFQLSEKGSDLSGKAVRLLLGDAVDKVIELRGNMESALIRLDEMALTIGQAAGIFSGLGTYENGDFTHTFEQRDVIALSPQEKAEQDMEFWSTFASLQTGGEITFDAYALSRGWSQKQIDDYFAAQAAGNVRRLNETIPTVGQ